MWKGECGHESRSLYSSKTGWLCENCIEREWKKDALKTTSSGAF